MNKFEIENLAYEYLKNPFPLWKSDFTEALVEYYLKVYPVEHIDYSIINSIRKDPSLKPQFCGNIDTILLESPSNHLQDFYSVHGIRPFAYDELQKPDILLNIQKSLDILKEVGIYEFVLKITRTMQIIESEDDGVDVSFSHPDIPFSIFFSLCKQDTSISKLRVAESILHECLHLKLTLIERVIPLISSETQMYYSPWKKEHRPASGILHGLFVFRGLLEFYIALYNDFSERESAKYFISQRIEEITEELNEVKEFMNPSTLTVNGVLLTKNLLPLNYIQRQA